MTEGDVPGTRDIKLTKQQRAIANPPWEPLFVKACPGAGKTRTIVQRFLNRASELSPRQGIAVLSFTNAAAREIEKKSHEVGSSVLTGFPNFVGTFDSFVNRFFVTPFGSPWSDKRPDILESWKRLDLRIQPRGVKSAKRLTLDELVPRLDGEADLDLERVDPVIRKLVENDLASWEGTARRVRNALLKKGYLSCADARIVALQRIRDECASAALGGAMKARFVEIIVDEAQDCNDEDIEMLLWLRERGISLVAVCDPDQAIYEFRGAGPHRLDELARGVRSLRVTQNWRSTPNICALAATLRDEDDPDRARGDFCDENLPVVLIDYEKRVTSQIGSAFIEGAGKLGISREDIVILAHQRAAANRAAGNPNPGNDGAAGGCLRIARAVLTLRTDRLDARTRLSAIEDTERLVLTWFEAGNSSGLPRRICEECGFDERWLRRAAYGILNGLPEPPGDLEHAKEWVEDLQQRISCLGRPPGGAFKLNRRRLPKSPTKWSLTTGTGATVSAMTVHQAKGQEYEAVLFVIPPDWQKNKYTSELVAAWKERKVVFEPKRVAYVAVTRSKRLLGIAIPTAFASRIRQLLESRRIPFDPWRCGAVP